MDLTNVNEPYEVLALLDEMNNLISTLSKLTDTKYYMDYIFNSWTGTQEMIKEIGVDHDYLLDTLTKFEKLRIVLFGDCVDWQGEVYKNMRYVAKEEREANKDNQNYIRKLEYQLRELQKKEG